MSTEYQLPIIATDARGRTIVFDDVGDLCAFVDGMYCASGEPMIREVLHPVRPGGCDLLVEDFTALGRAYCIMPHGWLGRLMGPEVRKWILRDDTGRPVDFVAIRNRRNRQWPSFRRSKHQRLVAHAVSLGLPIPGTGRRYFHSNYLRNPRTTGELRAASGLDADRDELPIPVERVRARHHLPGSYDDLRRGIERSWKRHRPTQWRDARNGGRKNSPD